MHYRKQGWPEEDEIAFCTISKILPNCVFANLDEYPGKSGLIHISEISPGRIRNIRDYVSEGRKVVCKVLAVRAEKNQIDLSLRRVNEMQKKQKLNHIKMEQRAEKLIENVAKELNVDARKLYQDVTKNLFEKFEYAHQCFDSIVADEFDIKELKLDKKVEAALEKTIREKIKLPVVEIKGVISVQIFAPEGVEIIKKELGSAMSDNVAINYLGAGKYKVVVSAPDYDTAEEYVEKHVVKAVENLKKAGQASFEREKK
ncbi:S1 RNA-binding domain-containing protein [Candidatus Woesearchaeota archaeon]|nr:S1 RNA-binding domain-containing protein [Candidatus Woesearchaeota archaeon]